MGFTKYPKVGSGSGSGTDTTVYKGAYAATKTYNVGDVVLQNSKFYMCNTKIATGETFTSSKWSQIDYSASVSSIYRGAYSSSKTYAVGDLVLYSSNFYICKTAIGSGESWTASKWKQIDVEDTDTDTDLYKDTYSSTSTYSVGDIVLYENNFYMCKTAISTGETWTSSKWVRIDATGSGSDTTIYKGAFAGSTAYAVGDLVVYSSNFYLCKTANSDSTFTASKWSRIDFTDTNTMIYKGTYSSSSSYAVGDIVLQSSNFYICKTAISTGESFTASKWKQIDVVNTDTKVYKGAYSATSTYGWGDIVRYDSKFYIAKANISVAEAFTASKWSQIDYSSSVSDTTIYKGAYSASSSYAVGDLVLYSTNFYLCKTAISTGESWTASKWKQIDVSDTDTNTYKGAYSSSSAYAVGDIVLQSSNFYICKTAISTGESFTSSKWSQLDYSAAVSDTTIYKGAYSASSTYAVGDVVLQSSNFYMCKTAIAVAESFTSSKWVQIDASGGEGGGSDTTVYKGAYSSSSSYSVGDIVLQSTNFYLCKTAISTGESFTASKWVRIDVTDTDTTVYKGAYSSSSAYAVGDIVLQSTNFYLCKTAISTGESFTASKWVQIDSSGGSSIYKGTYSATSTYAVGDIVLNSSVFYICKTTISVAESFTSSKWSRIDFNTSGGGISYGSWTASTSYSAGDIVRQGGTFYICITANSDATFTASKWRALAKGGNIALVLPEALNLDFMEENVLYRYGSSTTSAPTTKPGIAAILVGGPVAKKAFAFDAETGETFYANVGTKYGAWGSGANATLTTGVNYGSTTDDTLYNVSSSNTGWQGVGVGFTTTISSVKYGVQIVSDSFGYSQDVYVKAGSGSWTRVANGDIDSAGEVSDSPVILNTWAQLDVTDKLRLLNPFNHNSSLPSDAGGGGHKYLKIVERSSTVETAYYYPADGGGFITNSTLRTATRTIQDLDSWSNSVTHDSFEKFLAAFYPWAFQAQTITNIIGRSKYARYVGVSQPSSLANALSWLARVPDASGEHVNSHSITEASANKFLEIRLTKVLRTAKTTQVRFRMDGGSDDWNAFCIVHADSSGQPNFESLYAVRVTGYSGSAVTFANNTLATNEQVAASQAFFLVQAYYEAGGNKKSDCQYSFDGGTTWVTRAGSNTDTFSDYSGALSFPTWTWALTSLSLKSIRDSGAAAGASGYTPDAGQGSGYGDSVQFGSDNILDNAITESKIRDDAVSVAKLKSVSAEANKVFRYSSSGDPEASLLSVDNLASAALSGVIDSPGSTTKLALEEAVRAALPKAYPYYMGQRNFTVDRNNYVSVLARPELVPSVYVRQGDGFSFPANGVFYSGLGEQQYGGFGRIRSRLMKHYLTSYRIKSPSITAAGDIKLGSTLIIKAKDAADWANLKLVAATDQILIQGSNVNAYYYGVVPSTITLSESAQTFTISTSGWTVGSTSLGDLDSVYIRVFGAWGNLVTSAVNGANPSLIAPGFNWLNSSDGQIASFLTGSVSSSSDTFASFDFLWKHDTLANGGLVNTYNTSFQFNWEVKARNQNITSIYDWCQRLIKYPNGIVI